MTSLKLGVVILNYKDYQTTASLCERISGYKAIDKIVVVDNQSPDDSFEKLKFLVSEKIDVIQSNKNGGYSYGNNFGAFYLIDKYKVDTLVIANPDVEFTNEFIKNLNTTLHNSNLAAVSGIMLDKNGVLMKWQSRIQTYSEDILNCTLLLKQFTFNDSLSYAKEIDNLLYVDFLPGSLFAIKADIFKEIGGFDDGVFLYYEEQILSTRLKRLGYQVAVLKNEFFIHNHSVTINKHVQRINQLKYLYQSLLYYYDNYTYISELQRFILKAFMSYGVFIRKILYRVFY